MTQQSPNRHRFFKQSFSLIGGIGLLSSSVVVTQAEASTSSFVAPDVPANPAPAPQATAPVTPPPAPKPAVQAAPAPVPAPKPAVQAAPAPVPAPKPAVQAAPAPAPQVQLSAPKVSVPATPVVKTPLVQPQAPAPGAIAQPGKNSYIDTNSYGTAGPYKGPSSIIVKERSTGCQTVVQNGQLSSGACGASVAKVPTQTQQTRPIPLPPPQLAAASQGAALQRIQPISYRIQGTTRTQGTSYGGRRASGAVTGPAPTYNRATRLYARPGNGNTALIFPLSLPTQITSVFGWRVHPITGSRRMHSGTDIGAPMGTPVLAAYSGEVATADFLQGYGLTVILRHENGTQESRYAHLSEIFVKPGEWMEQGSVIGLVGSTGFSTGPHLHFEWRHLTQSGWVAVDAGLHLEYALENLISSMQLAKAQPDTQS